MMEGPRHQHLHQEWQEPLEERLHGFHLKLTPESNRCSRAPVKEIEDPPKVVLLRPTLGGVNEGLTGQGSPEHEEHSLYRRAF